MGAKRYPRAKQLLITADGGGSNSSRCRLWKVALQELAIRLSMPIHVSHFPPGTSKWNKIEHRMFCHITQNWRGQPLVSHEVIVNLIAKSTTACGRATTARCTTFAAGSTTSSSDNPSELCRPMEVKLALLGFGLVAGFLGAVMSARLSAVVGLILIPMLFAAAVFTGILSGSGMVDAMARTIVWPSRM